MICLKYGRRVYKRYRPFIMGSLLFLLLFNLACLSSFLLTEARDYTNIEEIVFLVFIVITITILLTLSALKPVMYEKGVKFFNRPLISYDEFTKIQMKKIPYSFYRSQDYYKITFTTENQLEIMIKCHECDIPKVFGGIAKSCPTIYSHIDLDRESKLYYKIVAAILEYRFTPICQNKQLLTQIRSLNPLGESMPDSTSKKKLSIDILCIFMSLIGTLGFLYLSEYHSYKTEFLAEISTLALLISSFCFYFHFETIKENQNFHQFGIKTGKYTISYNEVDCIEAFHSHNVFPIIILFSRDNHLIGKFTLDFSEHCFHKWDKIVESNPQLGSKFKPTDIEEVGGVSWELLSNLEVEIED